MVEIRIEGPGKNALGTARMQEVLDAVRAADGAPLLLTGAGDAFSAGLDLKEVYQADLATMKVFLERLTTLLVELLHHPAPTVAAINGHAIAGGALVALVCDHRIMTTQPRARVGLNEVALGLRFPPRILRMVQHRIDASHLHEVLLGAGLHGPEDAVRVGFADVLADDPVAAATAWLQTTGSYPRDAYAAAKRALNHGADTVDAEADARFRDEVLPVWTGPAIKRTIAGFLGIEA